MEIRRLKMIILQTTRTCRDGNQTLVNQLTKKTQKQAKVRPKTCARSCVKSRRSGLSWLSCLDGYRKGVLLDFEVEDFDVAKLTLHQLSRLSEMGY